MSDQKEIFAALAKAQAMFETPQRTKPVEVKDKEGRRTLYTFNYAPLDEILRAIKDGMAANGLSQGAVVIMDDNRRPVLRTIIRHESGQELASDYPIFPTKEGGQGFTSGVTYARRNGLCVALGIAPSDEDDDGNIAEGNVVTPLVNGSAAKAPAAAQPPVKPLPEPPLNGPIYDPETGEVDGPHAIPVMMTPEGKPDWIGWGSTLVAALQRANTREEGEAWLNACMAAKVQCESDSPKVAARVNANVRVFWQRFQNEPPPADFMDAP